MVIVFTLLTAELAARWVGPAIPRKAGSEERAYVKADQMYQRGQTDVVILGSSETAGGLIPSAMLDRAPALDTAYNAALSGARLDLNTEWADKIVLPQLQPDVVVIGMLPTMALDVSETRFTPNEKTAPAYRSAFDIIAPGGLGRFGWPLRQRSALIRYRPGLRRPTFLLEGIRYAVTGPDSDEAVRDDNRMDWETETDPQRIRDNTAADGEVFDYRDPSIPGGDNRFAVAAFQAVGTLPVDTSELERLVATVRARGSTPVVALAPIDRVILEAEGADLASYDALSATIVAWGVDAGVPVLDPGAERFAPDEFHDRQHLAHAGAQRWSASVGDWIQALCDGGDLGNAC